MFFILSFLTAYAGFFLSFSSLSRFVEAGVFKPSEFLYSFFIDSAIPESF